MSKQNVKFIDAAGCVIATARVAEEGEHFGGFVDLGEMPADVRALFDEYEEIVNNQMFSFLDEIQARVDALSIRAVFESGAEVTIKDLQIYPSTRETSFRLAPIPVSSS